MSPNQKQHKILSQASTVLSCKIPRIYCFTGQTFYRRNNLFAFSFHRIIRYSNHVWEVFECSSSRPNLVTVL